MDRLERFLATLDAAEIGDVTTGDVSRFFSKKVLDDGTTPATIVRYRQALHAFFNPAERLRYARENPVAATPKPIGAGGALQGGLLLVVDQRPCQHPLGGQARSISARRGVCQRF